MKSYIKKYYRQILSQVPIMLVLMDLHFEGVDGLDKAESQKHLSRGNQLLNAGQLADALTQYHSAIDNDDRNYQAYYMRATVYLALGKARLAMPDLDQVVQLQPSFVQARMQRGNLFLKMGQFNKAHADYEAVLSHEDNAKATAKVDELRPLRRNVIKAHQLLEANENAQAITLLNQVIESCPWNADYREMRSTAYEKLGDYRRAISDLKPTTMLRLDNTRAFLKMSILWYNLGEIEQSLAEIRECLKLDPDHQECYSHYKNVKKLFKTLEAAKKVMQQNDWGEAINKFRKALKQESRVAALNVEIQLKICECFIKDNNPQEALVDCKKVLTLDERNIPALLLISEAHTQQAEYEQAVEDLQKAASIDDNYPGLNEKLKSAQKMLKQSQKRDYYKILGIPRNADKRSVIKAYRVLAREWHPDNFHTEEEKKIAEKKFIEIAAAKEVLSNPEKKKIFHDGYDPMEQEDVIEWEKEQMTGKNENLFRFFFNHGGDSPKKKPFEDWFSKFSKNRDEDLQDDNLGSNRRNSGQQRSSSLRREDEKQETSDERHFRRSQQAHSEDVRNRAQYQSKSRSFGDKSKTDRQNKRNKDIVDDETVTQPRKENKNPTRSKKSSKKQFKKKSNPKDAKDFARQYTQGTDGKWYHKTKDGRWEVVDGTPPKMDQKNKSKPKKNEPKDSGSKPESYTDENGNVIVKGDDGNWYMRVKPPPAVSKKADSSREKPKTQENKKKDEKVNRESPNYRLPQGLFRNDRGQIHDRMGNIYERQSNGRYLMVMSAADAKAKLKEQLRSNKQEDIMRQARDKPASRTNQPLYKDNNGNVFVKDSLGNLIKVRVGGGRGKQSDHADHRDGTTSSGRRWKDEEDIEDEEERMLRQHWQRKRRSPAHEEL